jgi:hypothetical protein
MATKIAIDSPLMKRLLFLLPFAALGAQPAQADQTVTLKAVAGLGGLSRPGRWTPVQVDVDARGQAAADDVATGEIVVEWGDARVRRAISVASPSHKQVELYIRTADARDSLTVRLLIHGREIATTEAPVRLVAPADAFTACVAPANTWSVSGVTCSTTINPNALPHSWRGYSAADDLVWQSGGRTMLSAEQQTALEQWRAVQAIENVETSSPSIAALAPPARALYRTGTAMLAYTLALGVFVWPLSRIRSRSLFAYPVIAALVAVGSVAAIASGRIGPGCSVHVSQAAVVQQLAGTTGSLVQAHGVAEFPSLGAVEVRAIHADGEMAIRGGRDRRDLRFDENGAPLFAGTYGLGATATFEVEAVTAFEALRAASRGTTVRVSNISTHQLRACRFGAGFSRLNVGSLAPGQSVEAERRGEPGDAVFSCTLAAPVIELTESGRSIDSDGTAVVMIRLPEGPPAP